MNTKSSFPYAVKVEGYGKTKNQRSLFQFAHVTITEHMVNEKYGTKITNGPRVQMQTAGSKKKEDWTEVSKERLAEVFDNTIALLKNVIIHKNKEWQYGD